MGEVTKTVRTQIVPNQAIIMDNAYSYDAVSDVLGIQNNAPLPQSGKAGGQMSHSYTYDPLYRLSSATGTYKGTDNKTASYTLAMGYDNMHRITSKKQHLTQSNVQFNGSLNAGYNLTYTDNNDEDKKFQLASVRDINYRTEETPTDSTNIKKKGHRRERYFFYDYWGCAGNLKIKGSYNNSKATISKLTKKMTAKPITGRKAGVLTKRERKALKSAISD